MGFVMDNADWVVVGIAVIISFLVYMGMGLWMYASRGGDGSAAGYGGMAMGFAVFAVFPTAAFAGALAIPLRLLAFDLSSWPLISALMVTGSIGFILGYAILRWIISGMFRQDANSV
jgi:hypothetical protein